MTRCGEVVFVDETGTSTKMARPRGRWRKGQRPSGKVPWGVGAPFLLDGAMNRRAFETYVGGRVGRLLARRHARLLLLHPARPNTVPHAGP